jgi:hypothetical protein
VSSRNGYAIGNPLSISAYLVRKPPFCRRIDAVLKRIEHYVCPARTNRLVRAPACLFKDEASGRSVGIILMVKVLQLCRRIAVSDLYFGEIPTPCTFHCMLSIRCQGRDTSGICFAPSLNEKTREGIEPLFMGPRSFSSVFAGFTHAVSVP